MKHHRWPRHLLTGGLLLLAATVQATPQNPGQPDKRDERPPAGAPAPALTAESAAVRFNVQVRDRQGNLVVGLDRGSLRVEEDGKPQELLLFESDRSPVSVALLVEFSHTTAIFLQDIRDSTYLLLRELRPEDHCALVTFNNRARIVEDFTRDKDRLLQTVATLNDTALRGIELLESVRFLVRRMREVPGKKAVVLLASGLTETGGKQKELLRELEASGVAFYAVSMGQSTRNRMDPYLSESDHARFFQADHRLRLLAEHSGGVAFFPRSTPELPKTLQIVRQYLEHQYLVAYRPPDPDDLKRRRAVSMKAEADLDGDGRPDPLEVVHVKEYVLGAGRTASP